MSCGGAPSLVTWHIRSGSPWSTEIMPNKAVSPGHGCPKDETRQGWPRDVLVGERESRPGLWGTHWTLPSLLDKETRVGFISRECGPHRQAIWIIWAMKPLERIGTVPRVQGILRTCKNVLISFKIMRRKGIWSSLHYIHLYINSVAVYNFLNFFFNGGRDLLEL